MRAEKLIRRREAADMLGVSPGTLTRWAKRGLVPSVMTVGGHHRYVWSAISDLQARLRAGVASRAIEESMAPALGTAGPAYAVAGGVGPTATAQSVWRYAPSGLDLIEIRWHGRAGQGAVTASEMLAETALSEGRYFQAFPEFGAERTGAPVRAYTRLSSHPIDLHCPVLEPGFVMVLDATLLATVEVYKGLLPDGVAIVNTASPPHDVRSGICGGAQRVLTVDATGIALETVGRNFPNTALLGALLRASPVVDKDIFLSVMERRLGARFSRRIVEANVDAFWRGHSEIREE